MIGVGVALEHVVGQAGGGEADQRPGDDAEVPLAGPGDRRVGVLPLVDRFDRLDGPPLHRDDDRVECQADRVFNAGLRRRVQPAAEGGLQFRRPRVAQFEDLVHVAADQFLAGGERAGEGFAGLRDTAGGRSGVKDGLAETGGGGLQQFLDPRRGREAAGHPVGVLVADLVDLAAGQFDRQIVRFGPFHQRRGRDDDAAETLDVPWHVHRPALGVIAVEDQEVGVEGGARGCRRAVVTASGPPI